MLNIGWRIFSEVVDLPDKVGYYSLHAGYQLEFHLLKPAGNPCVYLPQGFPGLMEAETELRRVTRKINDRCYFDPQIIVRPNEKEGFMKKEEYITWLEVRAGVREMASMR